MIPRFPFRPLLAAFCLAFALSACDSSTPLDDAGVSAQHMAAEKSAGVSSGVQAVFEHRDSVDVVLETIEVESIGFSAGGSATAFFTAVRCDINGMTKEVEFFPGVYDFVRSDIDLELLSWTLHEETSNGVQSVETGETVYSTSENCIYQYTAEIGYDFLGIQAPQPGATYPNGQQGVDFQSGVEFQWSGTDSYTRGVFWLSKKVNGWYSNTRGVNVGGASSRVVSGLEGSTEYAWQIELIDTRDSSVRSRSDLAYFRTLPMSPTLSGVIDQGRARLSWTPIGGADRYRVRRINLDSGQTDFFETSSTEFWDDTSVVEESQTFSGAVSFDVRTIDSSGAESRPSNPKLYTVDYGLGKP